MSILCCCIMLSNNIELLKDQLYCINEKVYFNEYENMIDLERSFMKMPGFQ